MCSETISSDMQVRVCVTGANGFVATQIIKDFLGTCPSLGFYHCQEKGFAVTGTVRSLAKDSAYKHLLGFQNAATSLKIVEADIQSVVRKLLRKRSGEQID